MTCGITNPKREENTLRPTPSTPSHSLLTRGVTNLMAGQVPAERSTKDGSVYGQDANAATTPKYETITFSRMYRHSIDVVANGYDPAVVPANRATSGGWTVLPIQNAAIAAMRPRDWAALNNLACKWKIKSFGLNASNFNCVESEAQTNKVETATIPNLFLEGYVDHDHDLPGYEGDFLYQFATNKYYTEGDVSSGVESDIGLKKYQWTNTSGTVFHAPNELNLLNGNGFQFIKQTDNFDFHWDVPSGEQKWRHVASPWQYQVNPNEAAQGEANWNEVDGYHMSREKSTRSHPAQPNLAWGGFPTTARQMQTAGQAKNISGVPFNQGRADFSAKANPNIGDAMLRPTGMLSNMGNGSANEGFGNRVTDEYNYWAAYDDACKNQISGVPISFTPPPFILLRANQRAGNALAHWEFFCKYYMTIEYRRNQLGYFPIDQGNSATSNWSGCGNLGFVTQPGAGRMDPNRGVPNTDEGAFDYPDGETWRPWNEPPVPAVSDYEVIAKKKADRLRRSKRLADTKLRALEGMPPVEKKKKKTKTVIKIDEGIYYLFKVICSQTCH